MRKFSIFFLEHLDLTHMWQINYMNDILVYNTRNGV